MYNNKYNEFYGRTYLSQEFKLEDKYNPVVSYATGLYDLMYFNMDRESHDSYLVFEAVIRRRNYLTGECITAPVGFFIINIFEVSTFSNA